MNKSINETLKNTIAFEQITEISLMFREQAFEDGVTDLIQYDNKIIIDILNQANPEIIRNVLDLLGSSRKEAVLLAAPDKIKQKWKQFLSYKPNSVGSFMELPIAAFSPEQSVTETIEKIKKIPKDKIFTYGYVVDKDNKLTGVVVLRDLLLADSNNELQQFMLKNPFYLTPELNLSDAMKKVVALHIPEYPVCNNNGELIGTVRGQSLFEGQTIEISAQAGKMVGVVREEHTSTPFLKSFKFRHPWLQINLVTAFIAGSVVGLFQDTIDKVVLLAVFLPILAGQAGNTGAQSMAITIRALSLGDLDSKKQHALLKKELLLGFVNGSVIGLITASVMYFIAVSQGNAHAFTLSIIIFFAMMVSCLISGYGGAILPILLKKLKLDPAASTSIFLTTATDIVSMGMMLGLATWLLL